MQTRPQKFTSYRNIATCSPTQDLFDDLVSNKKHFTVLQRAENASSEIDHAQLKRNRPFQYCDHNSLIVFDQLHWNRGRFSQGTRYGVWYGALEKETSEQEILFHKIRESKEFFNNPKITSPYLVHQRVMLTAKCEAKNCLDLRKDAKHQKQLVAEDYTYCQKLGERAVAEGVDAFLTPSARQQGGTCTPIFKPDVILKDEMTYYFDFIIHRDLKIQRRKSIITDITPPSGWI